MASAFSHIAIPIALKFGLDRKWVSWKLCFYACFLSAAPDLDSIGFYFGISYRSPWGHRGFTHSIIFALLVALISTRFHQWFKTKPLTVFLVSFISLVSHGVLDALTNGGNGVAFFWPLDSSRYFFPWQVIEVSPISIERFFTERGLVILGSELIYIWLPCLTLAGLLRISKKRR